jgi:hypothetical protein
MSGIFCEIAFHYFHGEGPDAPARRTRSPCWQPSPTGRDPPSPVSSASRRVHAGLCCPPRNLCSPTLRASCPCAARCRRVLELSTLALPMLVALTAVVSELVSQARMLRTPTRSARGQPDPTGHGSPSSASSASCRVHAGPVRPAAASWSSPYWCSPRWRRSQLWSGSLRDRGVSGPGAPDPEQLFMSAARPGPTGHGPQSPVSSALRCVIAVPRRPAAAPGALHPGALHAGGAPSCGLGAGVSGPDSPIPDPLFMWAAWPDGHGSSSSASSVSCRVHAVPVLPAQALPPLCRAVCTLSLCCPLRRRPGALHPGAPHAGGAYGCGHAAGVSGPDALIPDPLFMWAAWPDGHGSSSSASSASCHVHTGPVQSYAASWSSPRRRSPRWRRSQRWPYSRRLGLGCSRPGH